MPDRRTNSLADAPAEDLIRSARNICRQMEAASREMLSIKLETETRIGILSEKERVLFEREKNLREAEDGLVNRRLELQKERKEEEKLKEKIETLQKANEALLQEKQKLLRRLLER